MILLPRPQGLVTWMVLAPRQQWPQSSRAWTYLQARYPQPLNQFTPTKVGAEGLQHTLEGKRHLSLVQRTRWLRQQQLMVVTMRRKTGWMLTMTLSRLLAEERVTTHPGHT